MIYSFPFLKSLLIVFASLALFPLLAFSHSNITNEKTVGDYTVLMSYFGDAAFDREVTNMDISLYSVNETGPLEISKGSVQVLKSNKEIFSGDLELAKDNRYTFFDYTFPDSGDYTLIFALERNGEKIPEVSFDVYVYKNPAVTPTNVSDSSETSESSSSTFEDFGVPVFVVMSMVAVLLYAIRRSRA